MVEIKEKFSIGDVVYIIGKYVPESSAQLYLMECEIYMKKNNQFVARRVDDETGEWKFSSKDFNKSVFKDYFRASETYKNMKFDPYSGNKAFAVSFTISFYASDGEFLGIFESDFLSDHRFIVRGDDILDVCNCHLPALIIERMSDHLITSTSQVVSIRGIVEV